MSPATRQSETRRWLFLSGSTRCLLLSQVFLKVNQKRQRGTGSHSSEPNAARQWLNSGSMWLDSGSSVGQSGSTVARCGSTVDQSGSKGREVAQKCFFFEQTCVRFLMARWVPECQSFARNATPVQMVTVRCTVSGAAETWIVWTERAPGTGVGQFPSAVPRTCGSCCLFAQAEVVCCSGLGRSLLVLKHERDMAKCGCVYLLFRTTWLFHLQPRI